MEENLQTGGRTSPSPQKFFKKLKKTILVNNQIKAPEVRVIDSEGKQIGVMKLEQALEEAKKRNLDLVQITDKVSPPVCKIVDYGKFLYELKKKERKAKPKTSDLKNIRLSFNISLHDLEIKAEKVKDILEKGDKVRVEMQLKGRERALEEYAKEKMRNFLEMVREKKPFKIERDLKKERRGFTIIISKE